MFSYHIGGLRVASDIKIPGARQGQRVARPDVTIARGQVPVQLAVASIQRVSWSANATQLLAQTPRSRFLISDGCSIVYEPMPGYSEDACSPYLGGSIFGFLLHQRGAIVLHASAVADNGRAILFCGPSGVGKSTLAAAFCQRGYGLVGDDFCTLGFDGAGAPIVHSDARKHRLTEASMNALRLGTAGERVASNPAKLYAEPAVVVTQGMVRIAQVYILERGDEPALEQLTAAEATFALYQNAYRPGAVECFGQGQYYLDMIAAMLNHASVCRLTTGRDLASLATTAALVVKNIVNDQK